MLLKEVLPSLLRVAVLWNPNQPGQATAFKDEQVAAQALKVTLISMEARNQKEIEKVLSSGGKGTPPGTFRAAGPIDLVKPGD